MRFGPAALICATLLAVSQASAQTGGSSAGPSPTQELAQPPQAPEKQTDVAPSVEHLLGDLGGIRSYLEDRGVYLLLDATTEFAGNVSGGVKKGSTFANQVAFENDIDWQRLAGIMGFSTHVIMVNRSGSSDSALFGDNFLPVQEIYGSGGDVVVHLVSAYAQQRFFSGRLDFAAGRMNVENDFASSVLYCNYMNNALCGDPKALPGGDVGHSAFPDAAWGGRVRARPTADTYIKIGLYEVNQAIYRYPNFRTGFKFDGSEDSGVYVPVEAGYEPELGADKLLGHYKIGFGYDSSGNFKSFYNALGPGMTGRTHTGNTQIWVLVDQMLVRQGEGEQDGIIALAGFVHNDPNNSAYAEQYYAGLLDRGFWRSRPEDTVALLVSHNTASGQLGKVQALQSEFGLPFSNSATGVQTHETILELNYKIDLLRGVDFQPDFQYVFRPNAQSNIHDAAVLGFRGHVEF